MIVLPKASLWQGLVGEEVLHLMADRKQRTIKGLNWDQV
jgi:hypothetical protein